jgi:hypothetical protein
MSKFRVNGTFPVECGRLFLLAGAIAEGQIRAHMIGSGSREIAPAIRGPLYDYDRERAFIGS